MTTATTTDQPDASLVDRLSKREREVCISIWSEASDKLICAGLGIREGTLRTYVTRAMVKLRVSSRAGIARQIERHRANPVYTQRDKNSMTTAPHRTALKSLT